MTDSTELIIPGDRHETKQETLYTRKVYNNPRPKKLDKKKAMNDIFAIQIHDFANEDAVELFRLRFVVFWGFLAAIIISIPGI